MCAACAWPQSFCDPSTLSQTPHVTSEIKTAPAITLVVLVQPSLVAAWLVSEHACVDVSEQW